MSHTPGPWGFRRHLKTTYVCGDCSQFRDPWYLHGSENNSDFLADMFLKDDGNQTSNMRLISAAPDLLAACEAAEKFLDDTNQTGDVLDVLRRTIEKAKGNE